MHYPYLLEICKVIKSEDEVMYLGIFKGKYLFWNSDRYAYFSPEEIEKMDEYEKFDSLALPVFPLCKVGEYFYINNEKLKIVAIAPMLPPYSYDFHLVLENKDGKFVNFFEEGDILPKHLDGTAWEGIY